MKILLAALCLQFSSPGGLPAVDTAWSLATTVPGNPSVTVHFLTAPNANQALLVYFPFPKLEQWTGCVQGYPERGISAVGMFFRGQAEGEVALTDRQNCAYYVESGMGAAYQAAIAKARSGMPGALVIANGESGGASMAANFAAANSGLVSAAVITGGMYLPAQVDAKVVWLVMCTRQDSTEPANRGLVARLRKAGATVLFATTAPEWNRRVVDPLFQHCPNQDAKNLESAFIADLIDLAKAHGGTIPAQASWPELAETVAAVEDEPPAGNALRLPGKRSSAAWRRIAPVIRHEMAGGLDYEVAEPAPDRTPQAIVIMTYGDAMEATQTGYDLHRLADLGCLTVRIAMGASSYPAVQPPVLGADRYQGLPVVAVHWSPTPEALARFPAAWKLGKVRSRALFDCWGQVGGPIQSPLVDCRKAGERLVLLRTPERETRVESRAWDATVKAVTGITVRNEAPWSLSGERLHASRLALVLELIGEASGTKPAAGGDPGKGK